MGTPTRRKEKKVVHMRLETDERGERIDLGPSSLTFSSVLGGIVKRYRNTTPLNRSDLLSRI